MPPYATYTLLDPEYLHSLPSPNTPLTPPTPLMPQCPLMAPNIPTPLEVPNAPLCHLYPFWLSVVITLQLTIFMQLKCSFSIIVILNCCHFATDHLNQYIQFTRYHL